MRFLQCLLNFAGSLHGFYMVCRDAFRPLFWNDPILYFLSGAPGDSSAAFRHSRRRIGGGAQQGTAADMILGIMLTLWAYKTKTFLHAQFFPFYIDFTSLIGPQKEKFFHRPTGMKFL